MAEHPVSREVRKFCIGVLRRYPLMKQELAELERQKQEVAEALPSGLNRELARRRQALADPTARKAFQLLRLEENWAYIRFYVEAVEDVMALLDEEKRKLTEMLFFERTGVIQAALKLSISEATAHRYENQVLSLLARRLGL